MQPYIYTHTYTHTQCIRIHAWTRTHMHVRHASSTCYFIILIWIKIRFNLTWINEMQIKQILQM